MQAFVTLQQLLDPFLLFLSEDPLLRAIQAGMLGGGALLIFLVFYATRDILLRTHAFWYTAFCILLVALLPGIGFLLYLLVRPSRTLRERESDSLLKELADVLLERKNRPGKKPANA